MSKISTKELTCPSCGCKGDFRMYDSVNVSLDPQLRDEVLSGRIFEWKCPKCGDTVSVRYDLLYHDMDNAFQIYYSPSNCSGINDMINEMLSKYPGMRKLSRTVESLNALREKIYIFESGLNDIAIELTKAVIKYSKDSKIAEGSELRFVKLVNLDNDSSKDKLLFKQIIDGQPQEGIIIIEKEDYEKYLGEISSNERFKMLTYCDTINEEWITNELIKDR